MKIKAPSGREFEVIDSKHTNERRLKQFKPNQPVGSTDTKLPRYYFAIHSNQELEIPLAEHFKLREFMSGTEISNGLTFPYYIPIATIRLAEAMEALRVKLGKSINCSGYRSSLYHSYKRKPNAKSSHRFGTAIDIQKIGGIPVNNKKILNSIYKVALDLKFAPGKRSQGLSSLGFEYAESAEELKRTTGLNHAHLDMGYITQEAELKFVAHLLVKDIDPDKDVKLPTLTRILRFGSKGEDVEALQRVLNAKGFNAGKVDGDFGKNTQAAVEKFQAKNGFTVNGEVDSETWEALGGKFGKIAPLPVGDPQRIIDAVEKVNPDQNYYLPRNIDGQPGKETFCNWFVADVLDLLEAPLPRYGKDAGAYIKPHPIYDYDTPYKPFSAEHLYDYFIGGGKGKWRKLDVAEAVTKAKEGQVVLASVKGKPNKQGHIAIVLPKGSVSDVRIAQAGRVNGKDMALQKGFGSYTNVVKYFVYVG